MTGKGPPSSLAVIVVNYASHRLLERNLAGLDHPARIVVVDNFSDSSERGAVCRLVADRGWELVELATNGGFAAGVNAGVRRARQLGCTHLLLLNPDASVDAATAAALHEHCVANARTMVSPTVVDSSGVVLFQGSYIEFSTGALGRRPRGEAGAWLGGACLALSMELFDAVGGLDEGYFLYWEDVDLSRRVIATGGDLQVREDLRAVHDEGGTQGVRRGTAKSNRYYYYNCRNRLRFAARHLTPRDIVRWVRHTPVQSAHILLRGGRRQLVRSPSVIAVAVAGSLAGLSIATGALLKPVRPPREGGVRVLIAHPSADMYGSDRVLLESVSALTGGGAMVTVTVPESGPLVAQLERRGATVAYCATPVLRKSALRPGGMLRLLHDGLSGLFPAVRLLRRTGADVVLVSTVTVPLWSMLARLLGRGVVAHVHEAERGQPRSVRRLMGLPLRCAHHVLVNSEFSRGVLTETNRSLCARSTVLLNAVPAPPAPCPARTELDGPLRVLYLGRLSPRKGPQILLGAVGELAARGTAVQLTLVGAVFPGYEWFESELREQAARARRTHGVQVSFVGFDPEVWAHIAAADVVCVPSVLDEPFGNTAVEAVLAARPVVVSATGGLLEAVADYECALRASPGDVGAWADALDEVVERWPDLRAAAISDAGTAARRHAASRYADEIRAVVADAAAVSGNRE